MEDYCTLLEAGRLRAERTEDWPGAMDAFTRAWESRPQRLEAVYELASRLRLRLRLRLKGRHRTAYAFLADVVGRPEPDDLLFTRSWVYRWGLLFEFSIAAHWVGDLAGVLRACDRLLAMPDLPETIRRQTEINREFSARRTVGLPSPSAPGRRPKAGRGVKPGRRK
ncbi:hypothetical protein ABZ092_40905 [Streptomyces bobili]|uniref:hypothetical protein n=1 Tax=Streptomyces bobili TaxID=67280 RepID=UPI0033B12836